MPGELELGGDPLPHVPPPPIEDEPLPNLSQNSTHYTPFLFGYQQAGGAVLLPSNNHQNIQGAYFGRDPGVTSSPLVNIYTMPCAALTTAPSHFRGYGVVALGGLATQVDVRHYLEWPPTSATSTAYDKGIATAPFPDQVLYLNWSATEDKFKVKVRLGGGLTAAPIVVLMPLRPESAAGGLTAWANLRCRALTLPASAGDEIRYFTKPTPQVGPLPMSKAYVAFVVRPPATLSDPMMTFWDYNSQAKPSSFAVRCDMP